MFKENSLSPTSKLGGSKGKTPERKKSNSPKMSDIQKTSLLNFAERRSNHSHLSREKYACYECGSRQYPCDKSLQLVKEELKLYIVNLIEQKMN
jgi:hypothetical protein